MKKKIAAGMILYIVFCSMLGYGVKAYLSAPSKIVVMENMKAGFHNTLWETVGGEMDKVGDQRDIREVIHQTIILNNMSQADWTTLNNNDVIIVPVEYEMVVKE